MIKRAFLLSSGLGTRLRPLTERIPKPLVPIFHKPLLTFALDHLLALGVETIGINVRYLWEYFYHEFQVNKHADGQELGTYLNKSLTFFKEPPDIDTGGSLRHARSFLEQGTFLLHNGDILTNIVLDEFLQQHQQSGAMATLLLREEGGTLNVCYDENTNRIISIRETSEHLEHPLFLYCGIAIIEPALLDFIAPEGKVSLIDALIAAIKAGHHIGGFVSRHGYWSDIGTPKSYLKTHFEIASAPWKFHYPLHSPQTPSWPEAIHPTASIHPSAILEGSVIVGSHAHIGKNSTVKNAVLLPNATITPGTNVAHTIVLPPSLS